MAITEQRLKEMEEEMNRFEEEISGVQPPRGGQMGQKRIIGANTYDQVQAKLARHDDGDFVRQSGPGPTRLPAGPPRPPSGPSKPPDLAHSHHASFQPAPPPPPPPQSNRPPHHQPPPPPPMGGPPHPGFVPHQLRHRPPPPPMHRGPFPYSGMPPRPPMGGPPRGMHPPPRGPGPNGPPPGHFGPHHPGMHPPGMHPPGMHPPGMPPAPPMGYNQMFNGPPPPVSSAPPMVAKTDTSVIQASKVVYSALPVKNITPSFGRTITAPPVVTKPEPVIEPVVHVPEPIIVPEVSAVTDTDDGVPMPDVTMELEEVPDGSKPGKKVKKPKYMRTAAGTTWEDPTLTEWDPDDFRVFAGDLGNEVTEELLARAFSKYPSFVKAKVVRDKRTNKTRGYGFVSFSDPNDFVRAIREMNGKYVGNRPIKLRKSCWKDRNAEIVRKRDKEKKRLGFR